MIVTIQGKDEAAGSNRNKFGWLVYQLGIHVPQQPIRRMACTEEIIFQAGSRIFIAAFSNGMDQFVNAVAPQNPDVSFAVASMDGVLRSDWGDSTPPPFVLPVNVIAARSWIRGSWFPPHSSPISSRYIEVQNKTVGGFHTTMIGRIADEVAQFAQEFFNA